MNQNVVNFFKRNPEATACHLVLSTCFKTAKAASSYRKNMGAKKVSVTTKVEYDEWVSGKETQAAEVIEESTSVEVEEKNKDQED